MAPFKPESGANPSINPNCPACQAKRRHSREELMYHHPRAGTGVNGADVSVQSLAKDGATTPSAQG